MRWTDVYDIAIALEDKYPKIDILSIRYTDLWSWIQDLDDFSDSADKCSEQILQAIQMAWLDERS